MSGPVGIKIVLPIKTKSPNTSHAMTRGQAMALGAMRKRHHELAQLAVASHLRSRGLTGADFVPVLVTMTRVSAGSLDRDNLVAALKWCRDGVAEALGIDDGDEARLRFVCDQRPGPKKVYQVEILIEHEVIDVGDDPDMVVVRVPRGTPAQEITRQVVKQMRGT